MKTAIRTFPLRIAEVRFLVDAIHEYHRQNNRWPAHLTDLDLASLQSDVPDGWEYLYVEPDPPSSDRRGGPVLVLYGPFHMGLSYDFSASIVNREKGWRCHMGGFLGCTCSIRPPGNTTDRVA
jgi:hypothetical protein